jgi:1-deoxy-D-xylulose 5-phosphate reductoisomerase
MFIMATLIGSTSGVTFGATNETGILLNSFNLSASSDKVEIKNASGDVALVAYSNQKVTGSVVGTIAGTSGVAAASVGVALTLANMESVGGVTTGTVCVDSVATAKAQGAFKTITVNFTRYPQI